MGIDAVWAREQLQPFVEMTTLFRPPSPQGVVNLGDNRRPKAPRDEIVAAAQVVEQVLDRVLPRWRTEVGADAKGRWQQHREAAQRALVYLERDEEVRASLGEDAPTLDASRLHPWVWQGARSLWDSGHYAEAVAAAGRKINAETQNKVARRNLSETKLFQQVFSTDAPAPGKARLRLQDDDGGETYKNIHRGAMALAEGLFAAVRNPIAHEADAELSEQDGLERLAAFSILARWIDGAEVHAVDS